GHCLISRENPARAVEQSGERLGYVHFDDNDGANDVHWPLLTGQLTEEMLRATIAALAARDFRGGLGLELSPNNVQPVGAVRQGKALLEKLLTATIPTAGT